MLLDLCCAASAAYNLHIGSERLNVAENSPKNKNNKDQ